MAGATRAITVHCSTAGLDYAGDEKEAEDAAAAFVEMFSWNFDSDMEFFIQMAPERLFWNRDRNRWEYRQFMELFIRVLVRGVGLFKSIRSTHGILKDSQSWQEERWRVGLDTDHDITDTSLRSHVAPRQPTAVPKRLLSMCSFTPASAE